MRRGEVNDIVGASLDANEVGLFFLCRRLDLADEETLLEEALEMPQLCLPYFNVALFVNVLMLKDNFKKMRVGEAKGKKNSFWESAFLENVISLMFVFFLFQRGCFECSHSRSLSPYLPLLWLSCRFPPQCISASPGEQV